MTRDSEPPTAAALFRAIWDGLCGVLGTQTTAVIMRRAAASSRARRGDPDARPAPSVVRQDFEYTYALPRAWERQDPDALEDMRRLIARELRPILEELMGPIGLRLLGDALPGSERHRLLLRSEGGELPSAAQRRAGGEGES